MIEGVSNTTYCSSLESSIRCIQVKHQAKQHITMTSIPIVQGTVVPSGGQYVPSGGQYGDSAPYVVAAEDGNFAQQSFKNETEPQRKFQDVPWAILFIGHLVAMIAVISMNMMGAEGGNGGGGSYSGVIWMVGVTAVVAIFVSCASLSLMMKYPQTIVKTALVFSVGMSLGMAIVGFMTGQMWFGISGLLMFALGVCYAKMVWAR
jgi:hypothetical protein